jgi:hypothetical protein
MITTSNDTIRLEASFVLPHVAIEDRSGTASLALIAPKVEPEPDVAPDPDVDPLPIDEPVEPPTFVPREDPDTDPSPVCPEGSPDEGDGEFETCSLPGSFRVLGLCDT